MSVMTQDTDEEVADAQRANLEFLLLNHPLDCPICDRGGECPLQDQALAYGPGDSRFREAKRVFKKPIPLSPLVALDRERCVLCARCTRFCDQISGDRFIELFARGAGERVSIAAGEDFRSPFSGNTVQICPVGALTADAVPVRRPAVRSVVRRLGLPALLGRLQHPGRHPARGGRAPSGARQLRGERRVGLRQGPVRVPVPRRARAHHDAADPGPRPGAGLVRRGADADRRVDPAARGSRS